MIQSSSWKVCQVVIFSMNHLDEVLVDIDITPHPLKLDYQFFFDIIIAISSFAGEIFGQTFDDIGINGYRMRLFIDDDYVIVGIIEVGDVIPLGSSSTLASEFNQLSQNLIDYMRDKGVESSRDVTFEIREEVFDIITWANFQGQIPIVESSDYDDWFIHSVLVIENGIPIINEYFNQPKSAVSEKDTSVLIAGFFSAVNSLSKHLEVTGLDEIILEKFRIFIRTYGGRVLIVIFEVKDNVPLPRNSMIYSSAENFLLALDEALRIMESTGIDYMNEESSSFVHKIVEEAYREGMVNL